MQWKVINEDIWTATIGRKVLDFLGCYREEILIVSRDKYGIEVAVTIRLKEDENEEKMESKAAAFYRESLFRRSGQIENDVLTEIDTYFDLSGDPHHTVD